MRSHFFELDTLISIDGFAWVVDKDNPNIPIMKISKSDFNLMESGIWKSHGNKIEFNGKIFWLETNMLNKLKVKVKNNKSNFGNLAISLQEFFNPSIVELKELNFNLDIIKNLQNRQDDIYIICSKQTERIYDGPIKKLIKELKDLGIVIKSFYYLNDSLYRIDQKYNDFKKIRLLLQHSVGFRSDGIKFSETTISKYDKISFYDNDINTLRLSEDISKVLGEMLVGTRLGISDIIRDMVRKNPPIITFNRINENQMNKIDSVKTKLEIISDVKKFESFSD